MWKIKVVVGHKKGVEPWVERDYPVGSVMYEERLWRSEEEGLELEDVDPKDFEIDGMLRLLNSEKIRSGYRYIWENIYTKARYPMFHTELMEIMQSFGVREGGFVDGTFKVIKRGTSYGIKLIEEK